jgi:hypothetical protein
MAIFCKYLKDILFCEKIIGKIFRESFLYINGYCSLKNEDKNIIFYEDCGCKEGKCVIFNGKDAPDWSKDAIKNKNNYFSIDTQEIPAIIKKKRGRPRKE